MLCRKCGAPIPDGVESFCPRCGARIVHTDTPSYSSASQCVITMGSSPLMLAAAIVYSLNLILLAVGSVSIITQFTEKYNIFANLLQFMFVALIIVGMIALTLLDVGIWLIYAGSSGRGFSRKLPSAGLRTISITSTVYAVFILIYAALFLYAWINSIIYEYNYYYSDMASAWIPEEIKEHIIRSMITSTVIGTVVLAVLVFYLWGIGKTARGARRSLRSDVPSKGSIYVVVINCILSATLFILALTGGSIFADTDPVGTDIKQMIFLLPISAMFLLFAILIIIYRSRMSVIRHISTAQSVPQPEPEPQPPYMPQPPLPPQTQPPQNEPEPQPQPQPLSEPEPQLEPAPTADTASWTCSCGHVGSGKFCSECGNKRPDAEWTCPCGNVNKGKFCTECGAKRPE